MCKCANLSNILFVDFVKKVIQKYPSMIVQGEKLGCTPLHIAAGMGNVKLVKLFLENGTSPAYVKDKEGLSAFHIAAKEDNVLVMKELITACPDIYELLDTTGVGMLFMLLLKVECGKQSNFLWRDQNLRVLSTSKTKKEIHLCILQLSRVITKFS